MFPPVYSGGKILDGFLFFTHESSHDCTIKPFEEECKGAQHLQKEAMIVCVLLAEPTSAGTRRAR